MTDLSVNHFSTPINNLSNDELAAWKRQFADSLRKSGFVRDADQLEQCGLDFRVLACRANYSHQPRLVHFSCRKRFCPSCARKEAARKLARYVPAIYDALNFAPKGYSLKKIELTTPFSLEDDPATVHQRLLEHNRHVLKLLEKVSFSALKAAGKLSEGELRRGRADLKKHQIGAFWGNEFGEGGHKLHSHILYFGQYLDKFNLITPTWKAVTGGECEITWVRKIDTDQVEGEIQEVCKYVTKFTALPPHLAPNLLQVIKGVRTFHSVGIFHGLKAAPASTSCEICGDRLTRVPVLEYLAMCERLGFPIEDDIVLAYEKHALRHELDSTHGNNSGEVAKERNPVRAYTKRQPRPHAPKNPLVWTNRPGLVPLRN